MCNALLASVHTDIRESVNQPTGHLKKSLHIKNGKLQILLRNCSHVIKDWHLLTYKGFQGAFFDKFKITVWY